MHRRTFLKSSCAACLLGSAGALTFLESCGAAAGLATYKAGVVNKQITIPVNQLPAKGPLLVRAKGLEYYLALVSSNGSYEALLLQCTHFDNPLVVQGDGFHCNTHGSDFDAQGQVRRGPAARPLKRYAVTKTETDFIISLS